jgi:hypothetical protein
MQCPDGSYVGRTGSDCKFVCPSITPEGTTTEKTYSNTQYGFSFRYPATWQTYELGMNDIAPTAFFGDPLEGTSTYVLRVMIEPDPQNLSAMDYVNAMIASDTAQDAANIMTGPAPQITPQFEGKYATSTGSYPAYELYSVFEFDHNAEQIYVQQNKAMIVFDFPVADANLNIASPMEHNAMVHAIIATLSLDHEIGKFCGGIAAFPCASGYRCKLDGTYPDAGGQCVKL